MIAYGRFEELHGEDATAALRILTERLRDMKKSRTATPSHGAGTCILSGEPTSPRQSVIYAIRIDEKTGRYEIGGRA